MHELKAAERAAARPLIEALPSSIYALSVVDGRHQGRVFVDNPDHPTVALVWEETGNVFISSELTAKGLPAPDVIRDIQSLLLGEFVPHALRTRTRPMCFIAYAPQSWGTQLPSMLKDLPPIADKRLCYRAESSDDEAVKRLSKLAAPPEGCEVVPADKGLLESDMPNAEEVRTEATKMWGSIDRFASEGFGYCVTCNGVVTSWSLTECPSHGRISVGVETASEYRQKGHGTAAAANTLLRCRREGLVADWDLWENNIPSMKLAERLGLTRVAEYPVRFFWFHRLDNLLVNGSVALNRGRPEEAAEWFDRAFQELPPNGAVEGWAQFRSPGNRAWWCSTAADAYEKAGMPGMAKDMRERAAREKDSAS
ncbi:MAG: GNAT family N-acetyltransferase [Bacillota bacterium]